MEHKELWSLLGHAMRFFFRCAMYIPFNGSKSGFNIATWSLDASSTSIQFLFGKRWMLAFMPTTLVAHLSHCCVLREFSLLPRELLFELLFTASRPSTTTVAHHSLAAVCLSTYWSRVEETICLNWGFQVDFYTFTIQMLFEFDADDKQQTSARLQFKCALLPWSVSEDGKKERKSEEIETIEVSGISCFFFEHNFSANVEVKEKYSE